MRPQRGLHKISYSHSCAITVDLMLKQITACADKPCYIMILCKPAKLDRTLSFTIEELPLSALCPCYIISFILNSRICQAPIGYRKFLLLVAKISTLQSSPRPRCSSPRFYSTRPLCRTGSSLR